MNEKLLRYLLEQQLLTAEQADELRRAQEETNKSIRELILERAILPEEQVIEALSSLTRTPVVHLYEMTIPMDVRQAVRPDILRTYTMMPFQFDPEDSGTLYVAMNEPMNMKGRDMVAIASKCRIKPFLATTSDILVTIDRCYGSEEMQEAAELYTQTNERESASLEDQVFQEDVNASPVVVLVNSLVEQAVRQRASDIRVESGPDKVRVRCRVDGVLYTTATYDLQLLPAIIARIKILSNLDISEKRRPQDGRFSILVDRREYDVRVSTLPTVYGEKCVMRLTQKKEYDRYVAIQGKEADGKANLSFHRFNISVTGYRFELAAPQCALIFCGEFRGDVEAKKHLSKLGFTLKGETDTVSKNKMSDASNREFVKEEGDAYLFELYLIRSFKKNPPATAYTEKFSATAQATFKNNETQESETKEWSFKEAWQNSNMKQEDKEILQNFLNEFGITI